MQLSSSSPAAFCSPSSRRYTVQCSSSSRSAPTSTVDFARAAVNKLRTFSTHASESARRQLAALDREHSLREKAARLGKRVEEAARDLDQTYQVRRRARNGLEYVQRRWPAWQKQLDEFSETWVGKATIVTGIVLIVSSPLFWRFLNVLLLVWWLAIPLTATLVNAAQRRAAEQATSAAEEQRRRQQQNPFAEFFRARASSSGKTAGRYSGYEGPVVDAEYQVLEPKDSGHSDSSRSKR